MLIPCSGFSANEGFTLSGRLISIILQRKMIIGEGQIAGLEGHRRFIVTLPKKKEER